LAPGLRTIILERNRLVARRIARIWSATGLDPVCVEDPKDLPTVLPGARILAADAFDGDAVRTALRERRDLVAALFTAEPLDRALRVAADEPRIDHIFGRPTFESTPRDWELALFGRRMGQHPTTGTPFGAFLSWGYSGFKREVASSAEIGDAIGAVHAFMTRYALPRRVADMFGELGHELLMNALYDAPVDRKGRPRHAHDRKSAVTLGPEEAATLRLGTDGVRLVLQVTDPFGLLDRAHVFSGLLRALRGQMDTGRGGAGLGLAVCANATVALIVDVVPSTKTEVTGVFDLDLNLRDFRSQAKSLHYFAAPGGKV
jgi:hypothetical protein